MPSAAWGADAEILPKVSVVIPTYNEALYIEACIKAILAQDYPKEKLEIHVIDGDSEDDLTAIVRENFIDRGEPVFLHSNPRRKTPISLNIGIKASMGDIVIILGAHTEIFPSFIQKNVENLRLPDAVCSGGTQVNTGHTAKQVAIGAAMSHRFGIATAPYRHQTYPSEVFTVVYGAYRREIFDQVGFFEEEGSIAEDAELNWRIIQAGYKIYFDPEIKTRYYPRMTFAGFAHQMYRYGIMRAYMFRKHLEGLSVFHFVPTTFFLVLVSLGVGSIFNTVSAIFFLLLVGAYSILALISSFSASKEQKKARPLLVTWAFLTMHLAWGLGFLVGMLSRRIAFRQFIPQMPSKEDRE